MNNHDQNLFYSAFKLNIFLIQLIKFYSDNSIFIYNTLKKSFNPNNDKIWLYVKNRNMADLLRTLAHELVHHMQNTNGEELNGEDGSNIENEANAMAGVIMREFGRENPEIFE